MYTRRILRLASGWHRGVQWKSYSLSYDIISFRHRRRHRDRNAPPEPEPDSRHSTVQNKLPFRQHFNIRPKDKNIFDGRHVYQNNIHKFIQFLQCI